MQMFRTIGGNFSNTSEENKASSIVTKLHGATASALAQVYGTLSSHTVNGGTLKALESESRDCYTNITIWMPNVTNNIDKVYPKKPRGGIIICSKVLRPNRTLTDAVNRIFKMHGNAVIAISKDYSQAVGDNFLYKFTLLDALGNVWIDTSDIKELAKAIGKFCRWSTRSERVGSFSANLKYKPSLLEKLRLKRFCKLNAEVADRVELGNKNRYFGNCSTRCASMFPSVRSKNNNYIFVSRRNSNKKRLTSSDMLVTTINKGKSSLLYQGDIKPSVDTPIQLVLYKRFPNINYMIHGHAYIKGAPLTDNYFACGDLREINDTSSQIKNKTAGAVNLRNHGFLIYAKTIKDMDSFIKESIFQNKIIGGEFV